MNTKLFGIGLASVLTVGTVAMTFNGESTLTQAKDFMKASTSKLELFKANESKLVSAIETLKTSKSQLLEQIATLEKSNTDKQAEITSLNAQVTSLNERIAELEELLASGGGNNEELQAENDRLTNELAKANVEITKANDLVASLQAELNTQKAKADAIKPMTQAEIDGLTSETPSTPSEPTKPDTPVPPPTTNYDYVIDLKSDTYYLEDLTVSIMDNMWVFEGTAQYPVVVYFEDGSTLNCQPNGIETFSKKVVKVSYKTSSGTTKLIQVNR